MWITLWIAWGNVGDKYVLRRHLRAEAVVFFYKEICADYL